MTQYYILFEKKTGNANVIEYFRTIMLQDSNDILEYGLTILQTEIELRRCVQSMSFQREKIGQIVRSTMYF
jgi:hypothetical protein